MTRISLLIAAAAIVGFAGFTQTSSPAHACAAATAGVNGLESSPEFTFDTDREDRYLHDGGTPVFWTEGSISIQPTQPGENASGDSVVRSWAFIEGEGQKSQVFIGEGGSDVCPD